MKKEKPNMNKKKTQPTGCCIFVEVEGKFHQCLLSKENEMEILFLVEALEGSIKLSENIEPIERVIGDKI